jgi:GT2 family glycosyltransferase
LRSVADPMPDGRRAVSQQLTALSLGDRRFTVPGNRWDLVPDAATTPEISVVIPHYNNQADLNLVLAALTVQTHPRSRLQVVIADDGSTVPPVIPDDARCLNPVLVGQDDRGFRAAAARNLGLQKVDGQVVAFLDGDTVPEPGYLQELSRLPALAPDTLVGGRRRYANLTGWNAERLLGWFDGAVNAPRMFDEPEWLVQEYLRSENLSKVHPRSFTYLIGAVLGCSVELCRELCGFDESFVGYGGEDYDFAYRAWNAGALLAYEPDAVAWHNGTDWSGRMESSEGRRQKNVETMVLADLIPEPSFRGAGQIHSVPDLLVNISPAGWDLGQAVLCVQSLLEHCDCQIVVDGEDEIAVGLGVAFRFDPRVHRVVSRADVSGRARASIELRRPVIASATFNAMLQDAIARDIGGVTVTWVDQVVAEMTTTRAARRSARWTRQLVLPSREVAKALFGWETADAATVGLTSVAADPMLAAIFGGWGK